MYNKIKFKFTLQSNAGYNIGGGIKYKNIKKGCVTMLKINSNLFNFDFFLSNKKKVSDLESGAIDNGGATKFDDGIYSNIEGDEYITLNKRNNQISVFVPSTMNTDIQIDNKVYIKQSIDYLAKFYDLTALKFYNTEGSWYSDDLQKVVYDNITIITLQTNTITETDINNFIQLANRIKLDMKQEGVSIAINTALAIV